jgi:hypothetical protein
MSLIPVKVFGLRSMKRGRVAAFETSGKLVVKATRLSAKPPFGMANGNPVSTQPSELTAIPGGSLTLPAVVPVLVATTVAVIVFAFRSKTIRRTNGLPPDAPVVALR